MPDYDVLTIDCACCELPQRIRDRDGAAPTICDACQRHQGKLPDKLLARAQVHETMLRERLDACRASEKRAQAFAARAREQVAAALSSQGNLAYRIVAAASSAQSHHCDAQAIGRDPQVIQLAERHRDRQYDDDDWSESDQS